ncbi:MAG: META domain-containing protein [Lautropia sp.]|nr:META domain-containing protein [Lautropia sp.]
MAKRFQYTPGRAGQPAAQASMAAVALPHQVGPRQALGRACRLLALGGAAILLAACVSTSGGAPASSAMQPAPNKDGVVTDLKSFPPPGIALRGTRWRLVSMAGHDGSAPWVEPPNLLLQADGSAVAGFAGCNRYFGTYRLHEKRLSLGQLGVTKRLCDPAANQLERAFLAALNATDRLVKDGTQLVLQDASGNMLLRFEADPAETRLMPADRGEASLPTPGGDGPASSCSE